MATIKYVKTPDGVTHNIGGGGGTPVTYSISLGAVSSNAVPIILTGSNGTTDTVYVKGGGDATMSVSGDTMTITASSGQTITYTLSGSGTTTTYTITATPSSGTPTSVTIPAATTSAAGLMTDADKTKLDGITAGAEPNVQSDWSQTNSSADDYIKNKPSIPTVNNATLTIQKNGTTIDTFTANSSTNKTVNVTVPTTTSELTNNSDFVSDASYVHTDNNFTNADVTKLNGIEAGAEVNVQANWTQTTSTADDYIKNKPSLATVATTGDYDDLTDKPTIPTVSVTQKTSIGTNIADITINGSTTQLFAPSGGGGAIEYTLSGSGDDDEYTITATPTSGTATSATIPAANQTDAGVMTAADKTKLDGVATGAEVNVQADWNESDSTSDAYIQNKPTIQTVNDGTLTIQKNGTTIDTFTANQSSNTTVNVTVPTATSELNNDSDFVSDASYVHTDNNYTTTDATKLGNIADYVIETGTSNSWRYRKWNGGDYECWRTLTPTVKSGTSFNGLYYATYTVNANFPITFTAVPNVIASCRSGAMGFLGDITLTASKITSYDMYRAGGGNVGSALSVYVIGRWK